MKTNQFYLGNPQFYMKTAALKLRQIRQIRTNNNQAISRQNALNTNRMHNVENGLQRRNYQPKERSQMLKTKSKERYTTMKKILAITLAIIVCLTMEIPVFAETMDNNTNIHTIQYLYISFYTQRPPTASVPVSADSVIHL